MMDKFVVKVQATKVLESAYRVEAEDEYWAVQAAELRFRAEYLELTGKRYTGGLTMWLDDARPDLRRTVAR